MGSSKSIFSSIQFHHFLSLNQFQKLKRSIYALLSLFLLLLLACHVTSIFLLNLPLTAKTPSGTSPENAAGKSRKWEYSNSVKLTSFMVYAIKEENPVSKLQKEPPLLHKSRNLVSLSENHTEAVSRTQGGNVWNVVKILSARKNPKRFSNKVKKFFGERSCKFRFFMTWISSFDSFGNRELFAVEALFKSHPNGCLIIVSNSLDSIRGKHILRPFVDKGFWVTAISPDFSYLFENTVAESWISRLRRGNMNTGEISLGQNLSNLLRLGLLYKFGGIYIDTDIVVLKSFKKLRNVIGAQTIDVETRNWSRLNNAVMIFDKGHPLLYKFIEEFALTFDGNKWGHNGPYLVSRVVSRVTGRPGYNFTVLPPIAFYPVDWSRIGEFFQRRRYDSNSTWLDAKVRHIHKQSYAMHLWNKQSRGLKVEEGSIIKQIMSENCVFCNDIVRVE
ncbi:hypothetical protein DCAR_0209096 [Daucus carota subsp. sativus]|uniref:Alpha 1,4-glycosyltransferase domain-containing protein n=2 Tax=Daucus carota subsp. sativus TaxID=79200 RepID=A0AAF0WH75_DAUCS|nr:hypothetical protein DCAR_0209096 [Daucus carota subsp. sativus]